MLQAIIDLGSNTVRMNIYRVKNRKYEQLFSKKKTLGLVSYIEDGKLSKQGIKETISVLNGFIKDAKYLDVDFLDCFATASLRNIKNSKEAIKAIESACMIKIDLISDTREGKLSFKGAISSIEADSGILIDVGGGSSEIVPFKKHKVISSISLPFGSLSLFDKYVTRMLPEKSEIEEMSKKITDALPKDIKPQTRMIAVGGSIRAINKLLEECQIKTKLSSDITIEMLETLLKKLEGNSKEQYEIILKVKPERIHTLVPGLIIVLNIARFYKVKAISVSKFGIREGYIQERIEAYE